MFCAASRPCCLVVEDEGLIAMALEASLDEAGFRVAGPFSRNMAALAWLETHTPEVALIDVLLRDGPCTPLVRALRERNVPFAIYSGLKRGHRHGDLAEAPWLEKPIARDELTRVLWGMVREGQPLSVASATSADARALVDA
jgi:DNA-binding response OmpR family regulator